MFTNDKPFMVSGSLKDTFNGTLEKTLRFIVDIYEKQQMNYVELKK